MDRSAFPWTDVRKRCDRTSRSNKLIYTTPAPIGDTGLHFCDSDGNCQPIDKLGQYHPEIDVSDWDLCNSGGFAKLGQGRSSSRPEDPTADDYYSIIAIYIMSTYVFTVAEVLPYLHIIGELNTGKTLLADLIEDLALNATQAVSITVPTSAVTIFPAAAMTSGGWSCSR